MRSWISSSSVAMYSMKEPMVQKRRGEGKGGERDMPPARTQCFSKSSRDFVFRAWMKPCTTVRIASISDGGGDEDGIFQHIVSELMLVSCMSR